MKTLLRVVALLGLSLAGACGDGTAGQGETCRSSSECGEGLLCDYLQDPPRCAGMLTPVPDAAPDAAVDAATADAPIADAATSD